MASCVVQARDLTDGQGAEGWDQLRGRALELTLRDGLVVSSTDPLRSSRSRCGGGLAVSSELRANSPAHTQEQLRFGHHDLETW